ncbi:uncharacterized protein LOC105159567 [Sesamum indicum]|uniref:Uncharacterized protein LOC105159567 n=1 Tax=Sesamum indicum TaxID=4182 RepID=A0A6I9T3T8_SESIN|nr:uncharacterized protein LOC105159567 [Sesamum indicum]
MLFVSIDSCRGGIDILLDSGGSNDNFGGVSGNSGGGGGGNADNDDNSKGGLDGSEDQNGAAREVIGSRYISIVLHLHFTSIKSCFGIDSGSWTVCFSSWSDGFSLQEVREDLSD